MRPGGGHLLWPWCLVLGCSVVFVFCCYEGRAVLNFFCVVGDMHGCECRVFVLREMFL